MGLSTTYTKVETDFLIQQLEKKTASGYKGDLIKTDVAPTSVGFYGLLETGVYTNLGGIDAQAGKLNFASFDGTTWSLIAVDMPITIYNENELNPTSTNIAETGSTVFDFLKKEINTINLFNKKNLKLNTTFNTQNGEIAPSNSVNAISELIPVESDTFYSLSLINENNSDLNSLLATYIVEYGENKNYLGFFNLTVNGNFKTSVTTKFIRINPNCSDGFEKYIEQIVLSKSSSFPFGYLNYGEFPSKNNNDFSFYKKQNFITTSIAPNIGFSYSDDTLTISSGLKNNLHGNLLFSFLFGMEYTGFARICIKLITNSREFLSLLQDSNSVILNQVSGSTQPKITYCEGNSENEFFIFADGFFNKNDGIIFFKNSAQNFTFIQEQNIKIELSILYLDENGKPRGIEGTTVEQLNALKTQIQEQVPTMINQQIGSNVNDYLATHINEFTFLQPNYIQANSSFNFSTLTSAVNGKFISIIEDIDLQGQTIDFEALNVKNLKLVFNGGRILNGKMKSYYTRCIFNSNEAFVNVEILNQFLNEFALPEWFGAKIDGQDGGIGNFTKDDSFAMNQALKFSSTVKLVGNRTMLVKKPIILRSGNYILADKNFEVKLGDASNCTLLKNENVDIPISAVGVVSYPENFKRNHGITIKGGVWNGNGTKQNRAYNADVGDQPDVINTPQFPDGDGRPYFGAMMKFADIDDFIMEDIILKDARTYMIATGGLNHYRFRNILMQRSFKMENQDGIHLHGNCFDGDFDTITGTAGDDLIAVTTSEASGVSVRVGDVKKLRIRNVYNYGFSVGASITNPVLNTDGKNPETHVYRPIRLTYTDHIIDDVVIENVVGFLPAFVSMVVLSYLPLAGFSGGGKIGDILIKGVNTKQGCIGVDIGANTKVEFLNLQDLKMVIEQTNEVPAIIKPLENFSGDSANYALSEVGTILVENVYIKKGNCYHNAIDGLFFTLGTVKNLIINNLIVEDASSTVQSFESLFSGKINFISISNSKVAVKKIFSSNGNANSNSTFKEVNNEFGSYVNGVFSQNTSIGFLPNRVSSESIVLTSNPSNPKMGDKILKSDGVYLYTNTWNKL